MFKLCVLGRFNLNEVVNLYGLWTRAMLSGTALLMDTVGDDLYALYTQL